MGWHLTTLIWNLILAVTIVLTLGVADARSDDSAPSAVDPRAFLCNPSDSATVPTADCIIAPATPAPAPSVFQRLVDGVLWLVDVVLHLDKHLNNLAQSLGFWVYLIVFLVIFLETGVVIFPFLPGDSFLFALGALTAVEGAFLRLDLLILLSFIAAVTGDALNYSIGKKLGPVIFTQSKIRFLNQKHLEKTQGFYEKYGSKTIVIARFAPIIRTFAPFVAGIGSMSYRRFLTYNILGGAAWVLIFLIAGHYFGNLPAVKRNFHYVIFGIIFVSILPIFIEWWKTKTAKDTPTPSS